MSHSCVLALLIVFSAPAAEVSGQVYARFVNHGDVFAGPSGEFLIRRAGITAKSPLGSNLEVEVELEALPEGAALNDCFVLWTPSDALNLTMGYFKMPFCAATTVSNWNLPSVERPLTHDIATDLDYSGRFPGAAVEFSPELPLSPVVSAGAFSRGGGHDDLEMRYASGLDVSPVRGLTVGGGFACLRVGEMNPGEPSGYSVSSLQKAFSGRFALERSFSFDTSLRLEGEFLAGDNWEEADVAFGEVAPGFMSYWASGLLEQRLRGVPGLRSLEGGLSWSVSVPETGEGSESRVLAPMMGVGITSSARLRFTLIRRTFDRASPDYTDIVAELAVRF
jgi:hypothetical protein